MPGQKRKATTTRRTPAKRYAPTKTTAKRTTSLAKSAQSANPDVARYFQILKDPFSGNFRPVALPDQIRGLSVPACLKSQCYMPTTATLDTGGVWLRPCLANFRQAISTTASFNSLSWGDYSNHPEYSSGMNLNSTANRYRVLCMGVKVSSTARNDEVSGRINWVVANESINTTDANDIPDLHAHSGSFSVSKKGEMIILRPFDRPSFIVDDGVPNEYINRLYLTYSGDASDILIETAMHEEIIPKTDSSIADTARASNAS
ncbi:unnamed protein product, partial [Ectocarpus sp. 12 AP-2014]